MSNYAFTFDASACTGCKACQVACKDKNNLPVGVLWRRVYEVSGGDWTKINIELSGPGVWENSVFAYNTSVACNHCVHPKCAGVCPTNAYIIRSDGIVYIDNSKCMGCGYCAWACPYAAPQYNAEIGQMTKCDFCFDNLDKGLSPSCVAACSLRVLDFVKVEDVNGPDGELVLWETKANTHPFPLPGFSNTEPHLAIRLHAGMRNDLEKSISNREETKPKHIKSEIPLVFFTLFAQMAVGIAVFSLFSGPLSLPVLTMLGILIGLSGLISFLHLGRPLNAWQVLNHLKKSWLSREILMFGMFGISWLICLFMPGMGKGLLALFGVGMIYSMVQVYRLRSIPAWNFKRTLLSFCISAVVLGGLNLEIFDASEIRLSIVEIGLGAALWESLSERNGNHKATGRLRLGLIAVGLVGVLTLFFLPNVIHSWLTIPIFLIILFEEIIGRWIFYEHLRNRLL